MQVNKTLKKGSICCSEIIITCCVITQKSAIFMISKDYSWSI